MDKTKRRALINEYKDTKPEMGILCFRCTASDKVFLHATQDTRSKKNGLLARLNSNMYRGSLNREIQDEWNLHGADSFEISVIDTLDYDDALKTDYSGELSMLLDDWVKKFSAIVIK